MHDSFGGGRVGWRWAASRAQPERLYRLLGRLRPWTAAQRAWRRLAAIGLDLPVAAEPTLFPGLAIDAAVRDLREDGFHAGLVLPPDLVAALCRHAETAPCRRAPGDPERFRIGDIRDGLSPRGYVVAVADIDLAACAPAERIARDRALVVLARNHLGYPPRSVVARLYWSPSAALSDDDRRDNGQTIDFHYDIERQPTLYVFFYLGDTDRGRGAHVVIAGSHRARPLWLAWSATRQPEGVVLARYGRSKVVVLEGPAGFGFAEDPACFHKALPPLSGPRLVLQLRYS